jgi:hypothetical protein
LLFLQDSFSLLLTWVWDSGCIHVIWLFLNLMVLFLFNTVSDFYLERQTASVAWVNTCKVRLESIMTCCMFEKQWIHIW